MYANLSEYFYANMKRIMRINGVCEYIETCEYEANKIHNFSLRFASERIKKKLRIRRTLVRFFKLLADTMRKKSVSRFQEKEKRGEMITKNYNIK